MKSTRVLIIDDSIFVQKLLSRLLSGEKDFEVVGFAKDGLEGMNQIVSISPDLIILDVEMPVLDGLGLLKELKRKGIYVRALLFSSLTRRLAEITLEGLLLGASDYMWKPGEGQTFPEIKKLLLQKLRAIRPKIQGEDETSFTYRSRSTLPGMSNQIEIVGVASSTGGPDALRTLLSGLPANFRAPILIVQHMSAILTDMLNLSLGRHSVLPVEVAEDGKPLHGGRVYIAPGGRHLILKRSGDSVLLGLDDGPLINSLRPSADLLFKSMAEIYGEKALAVVLTGMGQDGLEGCRAISAAGGRVFAQDAESSVVWGMPGAVIRANLNAKQLPIDDLAFELVKKVGVTFKPDAK